ncbi:NAD(P)/FAD-dependent oxidoreductase [uncultured Nostoc sp.]|uniref:NAD(P)/FAD-dependent oxidoreductase n=1 Tax=uncultured Nostoc sp. TaxID=340711 RepID=UPI0035CBED2B
MNYNYDLIIVGGGPAGSTMALSAHKHGLKVLLLDKEQFPRDKICGDAILVDCMTILQEFQLIDKLLQEPHARTGTYQIFTEHEHLQVCSQSHELLISKRKIFDNILFQSAKSCVDTREGAKVENLLIKDGQVFGVQGTYQTGKSFEYTAKIVAGADGCGSVVAKKLGLYKFEPQNGAVATRAYYRNLPVSDNELEFYYFQECLPGYLWIFPVDSETVNVGVGIWGGTYKNKNTSLPALHRQLTQSPLLKKRFEKAELIGDIQAWYLPLASVRRTMHGDGFILAGDAAGLIDPFWGDGIDTAMISGKIAGEILAEVCRGSNYSAEVLQKYADAVWSRLGSRFKFNYLFRQRFESPPIVFPFLTRLEMFNKFYFQGAGKSKRLAQSLN